MCVRTSFKNTKVNSFPFVEWLWISFIFVLICVYLSLSLFKLIYIINFVTRILTGTKRHNRRANSVKNDTRGTAKKRCIDRVKKANQK